MAIRNFETLLYDFLTFLHNIFIIVDINVFILFILDLTWLYKLYGAIGSCCIEMDLHKVYQRTLQLNYVFTLIIHIDKKRKHSLFFVLWISKRFWIIIFLDFIKCIISANLFLILKVAPLINLIKSNS